MTTKPGLQIRLSRAESFRSIGPATERVRQSVASWCRWHGFGELPKCCIEVVSLPRLHSGLGVGTQLALSVATALDSAYRRPAKSVEELAQSVGRGKRSAVGTHGFLRGGLIAELGKQSAEPLSPLELHVAVPSDWRFVLIEPARWGGPHGREEDQAFSELPAVPVETTQALRTEWTECMLPALRQQRFDDFGDSVYRFGRLAGQCFAQMQGGPYHGPKLTAIVERLCACGVNASQSSWGPTLFALAEAQEAAEQLVEEIRGWPELNESQMLVTRASTNGAEVQCSEEARVEV
jgi:beta-RFAP synthase